jgi:predicted nucleic acid-binding protein
VSFVVVDTDAASAILKGQLPDSLHRRLAGQQLAITFVTAGELTSGRTCTAGGPQRRAGLRAFFASVVVLPCAFQAATVWSEIQTQRPAPRATAPGQRLLDRRLLHRRELPLATLNIKDYADFAEHGGLELVQ